MATTRRRTTQILESTIGAGRIGAGEVATWAAEYERHRGCVVWIFNAGDATGYDIDAVDTARDVFEGCASAGLRLVVPVIKSRMVRMGAALVTMALTSKRSLVSIETVGSLAEATARADDYLRREHR